VPRKKNKTKRIYSIPVQQKEKLHQLRKTLDVLTYLLPQFPKKRIGMHAKNQSVHYQRLNHTYIGYLNMRSTDVLAWAFSYYSTVL